MLPEPEPEEQPPAYLTSEEQARTRCDRPGVEGGISFWDLWLERHRGDAAEA